jgi:hypothetical protein
MERPVADLEPGEAQRRGEQQPLARRAHRRAAATALAIFAVAVQLHQIANTPTTNHGARRKDLLIFVFKVFRENGRDANTV